MEEKLIKWVYCIASGSFVILSTLAVLYFGLGALTLQTPLQQIMNNPTVIKAVSILLSYYASLKLLKIALRYKFKIKLLLWATSLLLHIGIITFIVITFNYDILFFMAPEFLIISLILYGTIKIYKQHEKSI